jgi:voltage-gated potassium channel
MARLEDRLPARRPETWRRLWITLQAEDVPRLVGYFLMIMLAAGPLMFMIERKANPHFRSVEDGLWWSIVTLTTIGYGDVYPITRPGRVLATVVVLLGIGLVGLVTGKIASALVARRIKEGRGLMEPHQLRGHLVVLGWKADMLLLVEGLLRALPRLRPEELVLVNLAGELANEEVRARFPRLHYLHGDSIDTEVLQRAGVGRASKVLVLADETGSRSDQETDARTVMTVMNLENLSPEVYTCAEVLNRKHAEFLRLAHCDEIIFSREYGRFMLVGASASAGLTQVLHDLLGSGERAAPGLSTMPVPDGFVGRPFGELAAHLKDGGRLLIGLLENTGQPLSIKREALRTAQKTEDVTTLLANLQRVKGLVSNRPVLNPPDAYAVPSHSLAVVIEGSVAAAARP